MRHMNDKQRYIVLGIIIRLLLALGRLLWWLLSDIVDRG